MDALRLRELRELADGDPDASEIVAAEIHLCANAAGDDAAFLDWADRQASRYIEDEVIERNEQELDILSKNLDF